MLPYAMLGRSPNVAGRAAYRRSASHSIAFSIASYALLCTRAAEAGAATDC